MVISSLQGKGGRLGFGLAHGLDVAGIPTGVDHI